MVGLPPSATQKWTGTQRTAQTDIGHGNIIEGQLSRVLGQIPGLDRVLQ